MNSKNNIENNIIIPGLTILKPFSKTSWGRPANQEPEQVTSEIIQIEKSESETENWSNKDKSIMRMNVINFVKDKINVELRESDIRDKHTLKTRDQNKKGEGGYFVTKENLEKLVSI